MHAATTTPLDLLVPAANLPASVTAKDFLYLPVADIIERLRRDNTYTGFYNSADPKKNNARLDDCIVEGTYGLCLTVGADVTTDIELYLDIEFSQC
ncbi:MAG: hypothetical protein ACRCX2_10495 [Paraclostridium sp.]